MYLIHFPQRSNRASWPFIGQLVDLSDVPIDIVDCTMVFAIRDKDCNIRLVASTDRGNLTILGADSPGMFQWNFTVDEMSTLRFDTYDTGLTITTQDGGQTVQLSVGPLPIIDGIVP